MRLQPPPGGVSVSEWVGLRVRSVRPLRNGYSELPAGTEYVVGHAGQGGIDMASANCAHCGAVQRLSGVSHDDVVVVAAPPATQMGIPGLEPPESPPLRSVIELHCIDLERTAAFFELEGHHLFPNGRFAKTAAEFRLAAKELRIALAAELATQSTKDVAR